MASTRPVQFVNAATDRRVGRLAPDPFTLLRVTIDALVAVAVLGVAMVWFQVPFGRQYLVLALVVAAVFVGNRESVVRMNANAGAVVLHWAVVAGLLTLFSWLSQTLHLFDSRVVLSWAVATPLALIATHRVEPKLIHRALRMYGAQRLAVIVGVNQTGCRLAKQIQANPCLGIRLGGFFDDRASDRLGKFLGQRVLGRLSQLSDYVKANRVAVIYIALPISRQPRILQMLDRLRDTTASVYFVPDVLLFDLIQPRFGTVGGLPVLSVCESPYLGFHGVIKRGSDLILASVALVLSAPLLLLIAIGVKLGSPGPVLFKQRRYGMDGREIIVYKYRTMTCCEDGNEIKQAMRNDPRTTRFGAILRKYSLDELPQFINVLQGRMSVVGPRPHAVAHNEMYRKLIPGYMLRHKVTPGITGLAQVRGLRGETDTVEKMSARIQCDLEYLRNWSLWLDLAIVVRTFTVVLKRDNAW